MAWEGHVVAPTKPLTVQHRESFFRAFTSSSLSSSSSSEAPPSLSRGGRSSDFAVLTGDSSAQERLEKTWKPADGNKPPPTFVFATPETVLNDLRTGSASLKDFVLVVFDEAHRAVKEYAYTEIVQRYMDEASDPLILGLAASPGSSPQRGEEEKQNLFIDRVDSILARFRREEAGKAAAGGDDGRQRLYQNYPCVPRRGSRGVRSRWQEVIDRAS